MEQQTLKNIIIQQVYINEQEILTHLKECRNAEEELQEALEYLEQSAYDMTMEFDYEEYELQYEDETGIPAYECDSDHFQRWFEDTLLGEDLANIRKFLEELSEEKDLLSRLDSALQTETIKSPKELIESIQNYQVLKALKILQSTIHIGKDILTICDKALDSLANVVVVDSEDSETGEGIYAEFSNFIYVDYNASGYKDYNGEVNKALRKSSLYELRRILESITKGKNIESALQDSLFYDKKGKFKPKHAELSYIPFTTLELKILVEINEVNLGEIDLSYIKSLAYLFANLSYEIIHYRTSREDFSGIEKWDTSKVTDMHALFSGHEDFNADLSKWKVQNVKNFVSMFSQAKSFNADLSKWKPKKADDISYMFSGAKSFKSCLDSWDLPKNVVAEKSKCLFSDCPLIENPPTWYKAVFDMSNPSVELLKMLVKIRDYESSKIIFEKLPTLSEEEYDEIANLCFYLPAGTVGFDSPDKDFFTAFVSQAKTQIGRIPTLHDDVMLDSIGFDYEYAKYLASLGYKIHFSKGGYLSGGSIRGLLNKKPNEKMNERLDFIVKNLGDEISLNFFSSLGLTFESRGYRYERFNEKYFSKSF